MNYGQVLELIREINNETDKLKLRLMKLEAEMLSAKFVG